MNTRFLDGDDDDPIISMVNIIDIFLVMIVILFIIIMKNPINPLSDEDVTIIKNPGKENMEILIKQGEKLEHYKSTDKSGSGKGVKAGITYRLENGNLIYVPNQNEKQ